MNDAMLLRIEGLRIEAEAPSGRPLLEGLSFTLQRGERLGIVGESGSGKTLATRAIPRLLAPGLRRTAGTIWFDGRDITELSGDDMRAVRGADIGLVFQEPMTSLNPALTVGRQLAEGLELHRGLSENEARTRIVTMLRRVRITDAEAALGRFPHEFSGGMRQRIMLASVLLLEPKLLIADEPTTALDTLSQREVLQLMVELTAEAGAGLLLITHDLGLVAQYTERALVLERGVLVEEGRTQEVLSRPKHPYTAKLVGSVPMRSTPREKQVSRPPILEVQGVAVEYPGKTGMFGKAAPVRVLEDVNLAVAPGEIVALVGGSGSGKTTLGRAVIGLKLLSAGNVRYRGVSLLDMSRCERAAFRRSAQFVFQDPFSSLDPRMRIGPIVGAALRHLPDLDRAERRHRVSEALAEVGLAGFEDRLPHQMSGGQRQRVAIARAMVCEPDFVVADEPVSALDLTVQLQVLKLMQKLQADRGFACLFITHDLSVVEQIADRVIVLECGRVVEEGAVDAVFARPTSDYTRSLLAATPGLALKALAER